MKNQKPLHLSKMHEVAIVYKRPLFDTMPCITKSSNANDIIRKAINEACIDYKEFFWILLLNNSNRVLGFAEIGKGDTSGVIVNTKEIFQLILKSNATGLILCHNHPSGKLETSKSDIEMTNKIKKIAKLFNISLIDHLIITSEDYYSFSDEGIL